MSDIISSDPVEQARYEIYAKGFNAGVEEERQRILELFRNEEEVKWFGLNKAAIELITEIEKESQNG